MQNKILYHIITGMHYGSTDEKIWELREDLKKNIASSQPSLLWFTSQPVAKTDFTFAILWNIY